jgi:hypothetical protein
MARKREYEASDMAGMFRRFARAMARRAADGELDALVVMQQARDDLDVQMVAAAQGAQAFGYSWTEIGRELGISRQAARQRFGIDA